MKNILFFCASIVLLNASSIAEEFREPKLGAVHRNSNDFTKEQKFKVWDLEDYLLESGLDQFRSIISYVSIDNAQKYFVLDRDLIAGSVDISNDLVAGPWSIDSWPAHLYLAGEYSSGVERIAGAHGETFEPFDSPTTQVPDRAASYFLSRTEAERNQVGCFQNHPLRYGDLDDNGSNEIVLMLGQNVVMFSPEQEQIVFSAHYWLADEIPVAEEERYFSWEKQAEDPQYIAGSGTDVALNEIFPSRRSLTKLYFGSFEDESEDDIILWRKLYESKLRSDPEQGFDLFGETWVHYRIVDGVYQLQDTPPETLQSWLTSHNLTWQQGFPSESECEGQEGQVIPEMHDPFLNDPDVLQ